MSSLKHKHGFSVLAGLLFIALTAGGCGGEESSPGQTIDAGQPDAAIGCQNNQDCDDQISCTEDTCHQGDCQSVPDNAKCQAGEVCEPDRGGCFKAKSCFNDEQCNDEIDCTVEGCNLNTKLCETIYDDARCSAGSVCLPEHPEADYYDGCVRGKRCTAGADCASEFACVIGECYFRVCKQTTDDAACDDQISCTQDSCSLEDGCHNAPNNYACDDNNPCNGAERCDPQQDCQPGTPPTCDDPISCTVDSCAPDYGCRHEPNDALCDNHNPCDGAEQCSPYSGCQPGTPLDCNDYIDCTEDSCDPVEGCQHEANDALCDDQISCTVDSCRVDFGGCVYEPSDALCDDDHVDCMVDSCQLDRGCVYEPSNALCDDQFACTVDSCQAELGCVNEPTDTLCGTCEICQNGSCIDKTCPQDQTCNVQTGQCEACMPYCPWVECGETSNGCGGTCFKNVICNLPPRDYCLCNWNPCQYGGSVYDYESIGQCVNNQCVYGASIYACSCYDGNCL